MHDKLKVRDTLVTSAPGENNKRQISDQIFLYTKKVIHEKNVSKTIGRNAKVIN